MNTNKLLFWHMLIRGHAEETKLAIDSLQGLYDGLVVAVDDREDSDDVYQMLLLYPNTFAYRQHFDDFKRYDLARQDCLDKVPYDVDYVGWSDSDEVLVTNPYQIRKWLSETRPDAVNCGIHYLYPIGGHLAGQTYRNGRVRIWKRESRYWSRPCHEYPTPINGVDKPVFGDIIFNHIKQDNKEYRADHHIELMQAEIDNGNIGWMFYQAKEYEFKGDLAGAKNKYLEYIKLGELDHVDEAVIQLAELFLKEKDYEGLINSLSENEVPCHPMVYEYLAIANYWKGDKKLAGVMHEKAKACDGAVGKYPNLVNNDKYFGNEESI